MERGTPNVMSAARRHQTSHYDVQPPVQDVANPCGCWKHAEVVSSPMEACITAPGPSWKQEPCLMLWHCLCAMPFQSLAVAMAQTQHPASGLASGLAYCRQRTGHATASSAQMQHVVYVVSHCLSSLACSPLATRPLATCACARSARSAPWGPLPPAALALCAIRLLHIPHALAAGAGAGAGAPTHAGAAAVVARAIRCALPLLTAGAGRGPLPGGEALCPHPPTHSDPRSSADGRPSRDVPAVPAGVLGDRSREWTNLLAAGTPGTARERLG